MQSNIKNLQSNKENEEKNYIEDLLLENKEIFNKLILENSSKKEKTYLLFKEYELMKKYEENLIKLIKECPPKKVEEILIKLGQIDKELKSSKKKEK